MYTETVKRKIKSIEIFLPLIILSIAILMIAGIIQHDPLMFSITIIFGMIFWINLIRKKFGVVEININKEYLEITNRFFFRGLSKKYLISEISKIRVLKNSQGENYRSYGKVEVLGFRNTPEKLREYDVVPLSFRFTYNRKEVKFGEGFRKFNAERIVKTIVENQKNN